MLSKPKYKVCKRLGAGVYEKCQTQKFTLSEGRARRPMGKHRRQLSDFGRQLIEKQKARLTYGLSEKQFVKYHDIAVAEAEPAAALNRELEMRLDNIVYRAGLAPTRRMARQMVSHGHITVNGTKTTIPSRRMKVGDNFAVREGSKGKTVFVARQDDIQSHSTPNWITFDGKKLEGSVKAEPVYTPGETSLDYTAVFEFYSR